MFGMGNQWTQSARTASAVLLAGALTSGVAIGQANQRPIEDFVDAQGSGSGNPFIPPVEDFLGWTDPEKNISASVDYAGLADKCAQLTSSGFGTTFSGKVTERELVDGRALVTVNLRTQNALTWATDCGGELAPEICDTNAFLGPLAFGYPIEGDSCATATLPANPALCDSHMRIEFINGYVGQDPLPELLQLIFSPEDYQELLGLSISCNAKGDVWNVPGDTNAGTTSGTLKNQQIYNLDSGNLGKEVGHNGFPVESIKIKAKNK